MSHLAKMKQYNLEEVVGMHRAQAFYLVPGEAFQGETNAGVAEEWRAHLGQQTYDGRTVDVFDIWYDGPLRVLHMIPGLAAVTVDAQYYAQGEFPAAVAGDPANWGRYSGDDRCPVWGIDTLFQALNYDIWRITDRDGVHEYAAEHEIEILDLN